MLSPYLSGAPLQAGDTVRLVAPSGPTDEEALCAAIAQLESWGLDVELGKHIRARHPGVSYLAGTDEERRSDLVEAWCAEHVSAVIALRGGYGAMRLLDGIDFARLRRHTLRPDGRPKLLTGSSDITALHQAWSHHLSVATLFCPMPGNSSFRESAVVPAEVASWLFEPWGGRELGYPVDAAADAPVGAAPVNRARTLVAGSARGRLDGGNLALLAAGIGSPESVSSLRRERRGSAIAMLEDVDEELYRLDNLLLQLMRSGWFDFVDAVVLGSWRDCAPIETIEGLFLDYLGDAGLPIVSELGFGHDQDAPSLPLGVRVTLEAATGERPKLWVDDE